MPIIMISSPPHSGAETLATELVRKTGWPSLNRKELVEAAREHGIKVGRLEISMIKSPEMHEKLAREKELYLSFISSAICDKASQGNLVYEGRVGHLLLPRVNHRLRVGLVVPREIRVKKAMQALNLPQDKTMTYLDQLDEDIDKWARYVHHQDLNELGQYDFVVNLHNLSMGDAAEVLHSMADMPGFQPTTASMKVMADHYLTARAKLRLAYDDRTRNGDLGVKADNGIITVTYMPRQESLASEIPRVLQDLENCREVRCTMAETNIMWIQEVFNPQSESFDQITHLARRWGAAVELLRLAPEEVSGPEDSHDDGLAAVVPGQAKPTTQVYTGGVEDDESHPSVDDDGLTETLEELVARGRSGGGQTVYGSQDEILETLKSNGKNALVVIGDIFLSKGNETRKRQTRELALAIHERLKTPVITADELEARFLFGKHQALKLLSFIIIVACTYILVFSFQKPILNFMGGEIHENAKWLTSLAVFLLVPFIAYTYSTVTGLLLKLIGVD
jgi:cytidylate kinase